MVAVVAVQPPPAALLALLFHAAALLALLVHDRAPELQRTPRTFPTSQSFVSSFAPDFPIWQNLGILADSSACLLGMSPARSHWLPPRP